jgi:poly-gamma-glutamate synthesis protein (capsule biosynthesis protein)
MTERFTLAVTGQSLIKHDIRNIKAPAFLAIQTLLRGTDCAFTNFEGTILGRHGGWPLKGSFFGCSDPVVLDALRETGFSALSLSNNHAFDLGPPGVLSTLEEVDMRGFLHAGLGYNRSDACLASEGIIGRKRLAMVAMDGGPGPDFMYAANAGGHAENVDSSRPERPGVNRLRLSQVIEVDDPAFAQLCAIRDKVGYTGIDLTNDSQPDDPPLLALQDELAIGRAIFKRSGRFGRSVRIDGNDIEQNLNSIAKAAGDGCLVIAYLHHHHWASDWYQVPDWVASVAKKCIDAGAAMFLSHGAPVLQPVEIYRQRPIFYSLGNFIFHVRSEKSSWHAPEVWESVVGICSYAQDNNLIDIKFYPVVIGGERGLNDRILEDRLAPHLVTGEGAEKILRRFQAQSAALGTQMRLVDGIGVWQA